MVKNLLTRLHFKTSSNSTGNSSQTSETYNFISLYYFFPLINFAFSLVVLVLNISHLIIWSCLQCDFWNATNTTQTIFYHFSFCFIAFWCKINPLTPGVNQTLMGWEALKQKTKVAHYG